MTTTTPEKPGRTLGLPPTVERLVMAKAYEEYATTQEKLRRAHNAWRRIRRQYALDDDHRQVKAALTRATKAALYNADAKAAYAKAKTEAQVAR